MSTLSPALKAELLAQIQATPALTRRQWLLRQGLVWLSLLALSAWVALAEGSDVLHGRPLRYVGVLGGAFGLSALLSSAALVRFATSPSGPSRAHLRWLCGTGCLLLVIGAFGGHSLLPPELAAEQRYHSGCGLYIMLGGGALTWLFLSSLRGADPVTPWRSAMTVALSVASWIGLAVTLQCPVLTTAHVLLGHVAPVFVVMFASARWGARTLGLLPLRSRARVTES